MIEYAEKQRQVEPPGGVGAQPLAVSLKERNIRQAQDIGDEPCLAQVDLADVHAHDAAHPPARHGDRVVSLMAAHVQAARLGEPRTEVAIEHLIHHLQTGFENAGNRGRHG